MTSAQLDLGARTLVTRRELVDGRSCYLAAEAFVDEHPDLLARILEQHQAATDWADAHRAEYYTLLEEDTGIPAEVWNETYAGREFYDLEPLTPEIIASQQGVADTLFNLGVIPQAVTVQDAVWLWRPDAR